MGGYKCPNCGCAQDSNYNYCVDCGAQLRKKCSKCETHVTVGMRFCPNCGSPNKLFSSHKG